MANVIGFAGLGVEAVTVLFTILALALPYWVILDNSVMELNSGLFRYCLKIVAFGTDTCGDTLDLIDSDEGKDKNKAVRAMLFLGLFCAVGAIVAFALLLFVMKDKKILGFVAGGVSIAAGFFLMIGMAIYVEDFDDSDGREYGSAFGLLIVAWIFSWIAGALMFFCTMKGGEDVKAVA